MDEAIVTFFFWEFLMLYGTLLSEKQDKSETDSNYQCAMCFCYSSIMQTKTTVKQYIPGFANIQREEGCDKENGENEGNTLHKKNEPESVWL